MKTFLLVFAIIFVANGVLILKKKKYGPEEGLRGNIIEGKSTIVIGVVHILIGIGFLLALLYS